MNTMPSAFYPGAGLDIFPMVMLEDITLWICMDSQPNTEFGLNADAGLERPRFVDQLKQTMKQNNFELQLKNKNTYTFYNKQTHQKVVYETNTVFPRDLQSRHYDCESIVMCGFDMEENTMDCINRFSHIITNNITAFEPHEKQRLLSKNVSTIIIDTNWEYYEQKNQLPHIIKEHVHVERQYVETK